MSNEACGVNSEESRSNRASVLFLTWRFYFACSVSQFYVYTFAKRLNYLLTVRIPLDTAG